MRIGPNNVVIYVLITALTFLIAGGVVTPTFSQKVVAKKTVDTPGQPAVYHGLQPDEFLKEWLILGPIPISDKKITPEDMATQKQAFDKDFIDVAKVTRLRPEKAEIIEGREYRWQPYKTETGRVEFAEIFGDSSFHVAYAWAEIRLTARDTVLFGLGSDDGVKVWLNGQLVHQNWIGRALTEDDDLFPLVLRKGPNNLLIKVQNIRYDWGFCARVVGPTLFPEKMVASAAKGDLDALKLLLENGADINAATNIGMTALHAARIHGREEAVDFLLEKGANSHIPMPAEDILVGALLEKAVSDSSPGAAVLVSRNGEILYKKGFGYANLEHRVPITSRTRFRIGSITKQFTAAAILKLQEEGLLSVNDRLSRFLPDFPRGDEVTIHHLLTHTSGIHSYTNRPDFLEKVTCDGNPEELIDSIKSDPYDFDPGEEWRYNNSGYLILGYLVEKISGESYENYLKKAFFDSLEMHDTGVHHWSKILPHEASGYSYIGGRLQKARNWNMSLAGGAGALYSTVEDLYRWNEGIFTGKVLSQSSLEKAFEPVKLNDGTTAQASGGGGYGYGWGIRQLRGLEEISHGGGLDGFLTYLTRFPRQNLTIAVLTNCAPPPPGLNPNYLAQEIAQIYLWQQMEAQPSFSTDTTVSAELYDDYVGTYEYPGGMVLTVTREDDRLFAQLSGQNRYEIFPMGEDEFYWKVVDAQIKFIRDDSGRVTHAIHRQGGREFTVPRFQEETPVAVNPKIYQDYVGEYKLGYGATLTITLEDQRLFAQVTGQPRFEIFPRSETEFFLKVVKADVVFQKNEEGKVTGLILNQGGQEIFAEKIK
ncbi:MAG: hypothetical protein Kow0042_16640 [Calditrichia bacterium]